MFKPSTTPHSVALAATILAGALTLASLPAAAGPPEEPKVVDFDAAGKTIGKPGGTLHMLVARPRDTRLMVVYGYARLVAYDEYLELVPDILKDVEVEDGRIFTLHLRKGHKWSDGQPFTSEDFRYWWEDVANNEALYPVGPPADLIVDGELPKVEILDELTVRYSWSKPNPFFLPLLAQATPLFIYMPAHYLKQFHERYADPAELAALVEKTQARDWAQLHGRKDGMYNFDNPELPTLQPWMLTNAPPATRFVFARNPHFHRVDPDGQQLPYIDEVVFDVVSDQLIPIKTGAGETDLQSRGLFFKHYTFLKESEERSQLATHLWPTATGAHLAIYPNLNALDEIGLTERSPDGLRLLPDGRPMELVVETAGEESEQSDILELVQEDWLALGIKFHTRPSQREVFRNRIFSGETLMSIWYGLENGIPTADMSPAEFAPTSQQQLQWPKWGQYYETKGEAGVAPDTPEAKKLLELFEQWPSARSNEERRKIWDEILAIYSDQVYSIALISGVMQPVAARTSLRNLPKEAVYNWEPGAQFGIYGPDTFWFDS